VRTAIVSDLHLGTMSGSDITRLRPVRERLADALADADRVVVLGDLLELRELPAATVLDTAAPTLAALGAATAGRELVLVPGNHDHELVAPALGRARLAGQPLELAGEYSAERGDLAQRVAALLPDTEIRIAYPGVWLRDDVYATHGHYLDLHLTIPRLECLAASLLTRLLGRGGVAPSGPDDYEAALAPLYAFAYSVVQGSSSRPRGGHLSRTVWSTANLGGNAIAGVALGRIAIPTAVAALNRVGLGPFRADISGQELRRAGLRAIGEVVASLAIKARHVIFGHTHRAGPLPGEVEGWWLPSGTRLTNTGSWLLEPIFTGDGNPAGPYWPGRVTLLDETGPPRLASVLDGLDLPALAG